MATKLNAGFRAYLSELVVDAGIRYHGIGARLILAVEKALRDRGQQILVADVWHEAEAFYRSLGWEPPEAILSDNDWNRMAQGTERILLEQECRSEHTVNVPASGSE